MLTTDNCYRLLFVGNEKEAAKHSWYAKMFNIIGVSSGMLILVIVCIILGATARPQSAEGT